MASQTESLEVGQSALVYDCVVEGAGGGVASDAMISSCDATADHTWMGRCVQQCIRNLEGTVRALDSVNNPTNSLT